MTQTVKRAWIFLAFIKLLVSTNLIHYLCTKTMDKKTIVEMKCDNIRISEQKSKFYLDYFFQLLACFNDF